MFGKDVVYTDFPVGNNKIYYRYFCNLRTKTTKTVYNVTIVNL